MIRKDRITNARIRGTVKVGKARLRGYGHVMRSDGESDEKRALDMKVQGRRRGRPKTRWKDWTAADMREKVQDNKTGNRYRWKLIIKNSEQVQRQINKAEEEEIHTLLLCSVVNVLAFHPARHALEPCLGMGGCDV